MSIEIIILIIVFVIVAVMGFSVFFGAPYIPTRRKWASDALRLVKLKKSDLVVDLGSGDGVILDLVAKTGAQAIGYEINPVLYLISLAKTRRYGSRVTVRLKNFWTEKLPSDTTAVYVFGLERDAMKLENYLTEQGIRGLKVITFGFKLPKKPIKKTKSVFIFSL